MKEQEWHSGESARLPPRGLGSIPWTWCHMWFEFVVGSRPCFNSLQSRRHFGERVLSIFSAKIMAAIFDLNGRGRLGRERKLYQGGE